MSTITKERLQKLIRAIDCGSYDEEEIVEWVNSDEILELARIALASLEAEPVAWRYRTTDINGNHNTNWSFSEEESLLGLYQPLYAAPPAPEVPDDIDARMKTAGMLSASEIIAGQPIDAFMKHAGVVDLESLIKWAEMRRAEFLRMQAQYELGDKPKDDMYEWVISHVAAFSELHVNIRAAMLQDADGNSPVIPDGYALVPVEPTYQMCEAMGMPWERPRFPDRYKAMLAAAPQQEVTQALAKGMERYGDAMLNMANRELK